MQRISTSSRAVNLFGAGKDGFKDGNLGSGIAPTAFDATWCNNVQEELLSVIEAAGLTANGGTLNQLLLALRAAFGGVVGTVRNAKMSVTAANASAAFTADEVILETALAGMPFRLSNINKTINLATVGVGGMDVGAAPVSGFVAIYLIYNILTQAVGLLATNATAAIAPEVYGGANMPSGYTASALLSVWPTNASSQFQVGYQIDRKIFRSSQTVLSTVGQQASLTALSAASALPRNARSAWGNVNANINVPTSLFSSIAGSAAGAGLSLLALTQSGSGSQGATIPFLETPITTPQTLFYTVTVAGGTSLNYDVSVTGYSF